MGCAQLQAIPYYHKEEIPEMIDMTPKNQFYEALYKNYETFDDNSIIKEHLAH